MQEEWTPSWLQPQDDRVRLKGFLGVCWLLGSGMLWSGCRGLEALLKPSDEIVAGDVVFDSAVAYHRFVGIEGRFPRSAQEYYSLIPVDRRLDRGGRAAVFGTWESYLFFALPGGDAVWGTGDEQWLAYEKEERAEGEWLSDWMWPDRNLPESNKVCEAFAGWQSSMVVCRGGR